MPRTPRIARPRDSGAPGSGSAPPHALTVEELLHALGSSPNGLASAEAVARLRAHGPNALPSGRAVGLPELFVRQFASPLIYVLLAAVIVSLALGKGSDAGFILTVLLLNAAIGAGQERAAQKSAEALKAVVVQRARVVRDGGDLEIDAAALVPGDVVRLESGFRVPADLRVLSEAGVEADESLLTGESLPVTKRAGPPVHAEAPVADRATMLFAGTLVMRGRASGVVTATGLRTELGKIASAVVGTKRTKPPLLVRMDRFSRRIAALTGLAAVVLGAISLARGVPLAEVFLSAVALAVAAIPEGLPVALTVALAIGARRMARRRVIARRLVAVEALGSCTYVASDKTGTLTLNELTARIVRLPGEEAWEVGGGGLDPAGEILVPPGRAAGPRIERLCTAAALCNDAFLGRRDGDWVHEGDAVDVAFLVLARKGGVSRAEAEAIRPRIAGLAFEPERRFAATIHEGPSGTEAFAKGAVERVLAMCDRMASAEGDLPVDAARLEREAEALASRGFRVLGLAAGRLSVPGELRPDALRGLSFLGIVGMIDPLRPGAAASVRACRDAGIEVAMVTGDHPVTSLAIARELGLAERPEEVVAGPALAAASQAGEDALAEVVRGGRVFARVDPTQKLEIVRALGRLGHFVAVTGDGANDAPALRAAHIGVAMGRRGTDVARESAELVLADDDFSSIVAGVEEGRVAYANVRKVVFLLVSTGAAEVLLFVLAVAAGTPLPLLPVQLLWLNLVTNGIQDVALACEPAEGGEMARPPRPPREPVFDRVMIARTLLSAAVMAVIAFTAFVAGLARGWDVERLRNGLLLMMVLFENVQAGNSRSETRAVLSLPPLRNPFLFFGTLAALGLHVLAMHAPGLSGVLRVAPAGALEWGVGLAGALLLAGAVDLEKRFRGARARPGGIK